MQKLGFPAMKSLDQIRSLSGSAKNFSYSSRPPQDSVSSGNFSNLKFTAEKLVKEQASMKSDLELADRVFWFPFCGLVFTGMCRKTQISLLSFASL
ncbi:unnamed protein product [Microthlaspi erraticum]|uniref:Uncharacterized protein n=1 Tax=Microthlaspi erraticum TaxID=1685480 RepID=A0A6D2HBG8_9BRAS|nr:unnamed protein product [Microthlaspi erraticum]